MPAPNHAGSRRGPSSRQTASLLAVRERAGRADLLSRQDGDGRRSDARFCGQRYVGHLEGAPTAGSLGASVPLNTGFHRSLRMWQVRRTDDGSPLLYPALLFGAILAL